MAFVFVDLGMIQAQDEEPQYIVFDYMKSAPGMQADYLAAEKVWKKIHQERIKRGDMDYWGISRLVSPFGTDTDYDFMTVNIYRGLEQFANHFEGEFPDISTLITAEEQALVDRTGSLRDLVREEIYVSRIEAFVPDVVNSVTVVNYMQLQGDATTDQHWGMEKMNWLPVHQARMDDGKMGGWVAMDLMMPTDHFIDFESVTVDFYASFAQMLEPWFEKYFAKAHPDMNVEAMMNMQATVWERVRSHIHVEVDNSDK